MSVNKPLQMYADIVPDSVWMHVNGNKYRVLVIANVETERPVEYPPTVVYQNIDNGKVYSRLRSDWYRSMTKV